MITNDGHIEREALRNAIHRCHNPDHTAYRNYGARGIYVEDELRSTDKYLKLIAAIGFRPGPGYSLDRIDNNGSYTLNPLNLRWADRKTQQQNRRPVSNKTAQDFGWGVGKAPGRQRPSSLVEHDGKTQTIAEWAHEIGLKNATIRQRLERGLTAARALDPYVGRAGEKRAPHGLWNLAHPQPVVELLDQANDPLRAQVDAMIAHLERAAADINRRLH